jgi:hypothetical protein
MSCFTLAPTLLFQIPNKVESESFELNANVQIEVLKQATMNQTITKT